MNCECNNKSNRVKPGIKHVYGNVLRMAIPLTLRTLVKDGDEMDVTDTDFIPSSDHPVRVVFSKGKTNYPIIATMDGNVAIVEDKGKIPVGTYDISVECYDDLGNPYRFKQNAVLYVADTTAEAGIDEEIEYEAQTWYLNAAVFLATTEIGEIGDVIDAKLDDVFGNVAYDADAKEIRFYNKGNSKVLATIDSSPFIADGTVADVYIDVSRQVLVVVLNEDAGGRMFSVPLYLVFNSYYKKDEVDSLVSRTVEGMRFDFSQELPLVVPVTKNGNSITSTVDFGAIDNAIREDGRLVVACVNDSEFYQLLDANRAEVSFSQVNALDGYQVLLIVDKHNVWSMEDVDLGTGGGGGYEPPAGGIPKTDLAPAVQASLAKADSALQSSDLQGYATTDDVDDAVAALVSSAPQTLDTLKELADALGDDPNFATTMATQLGNKVDKESGKSLMTDAERTKLQGIAAGAEVNVQADWTQTNTSADDYIKNKPTIPTKTSDLTNDSGFIDKAMYYGTSDTAAATMPKVCTVETFPTTTSGNVTHAKGGTIIAVKFTNSDTNTTDAPTLNVNGIGAKAIMYNNAIVTSTAKNTTVAGTAKMLAYYRYDPALDGGNGAWEFLAKSVDSNSTYSNASLGQGYGTQTNSSAATAITSSISSYALSAGGIVTIKFTYDVPSNATLNISSKGAKAIYNQGAAIAAGVIKAGDTATFIYSTYYHLIAVDSWQDKQDAISDLATIRSGASKGASSVQTISVNGGTAQQPTNGVVNLTVAIAADMVRVNNDNFDGETLDEVLDEVAQDISEAGETVVINSDGANIVDEHDNNSVLFAPSARQMKLMYNNLMAIYNGLAGIAFTNGKPTLDWVGSKTKYTLSYGTLTGCTADVAAGQVNEGALRIKLTPTQASYAFTSVTVNGESASTTATGDADGSVYLDIIVNGNITVAATAISGRAVNFNGGDGATIGAAGVAIGQDLDTTITANEHFTLPASITVKIGNTNVAHTYTRAQDNKTATLHIDAANITGDLTITCTAVEDSHVTIAISGSNFVVKQGNTQLSNNSKVYNGSAAQTLTIEPASGYKFSTLPSADKGTMTNNGPYEASSLVISTSVSGTLTITAAGAALGTFNIDLSGVTSDVGVTWTNPSAAAQTILEGSPFKITLAKVSGTGVLNISTCAMNGGTLTPNNGVIETAHVTGDITIAASVAAAHMKVHSYDFTAVQKSDGRVDGKPKYIEDDVAGHFRLYSVNNITQNSEATEDDPAWVAPKWSPNSGGSYKGSWANGINNNYRAGYGNRVLDLEPGSDFTIILKEYSLYPASGNRYKASQIQVIFYDRATVGTGTQLTEQQFEIQCGLTGNATYVGNGGSMYPVINTKSGLVSLRGDNAEVPATPAAGDVYDVVFSYVAQTGLMSAFVVKRGSSSEVLVGGTTTKTGLAITCMQVYGYGSSVPTHLKGIELYNYAMDKSALETLYGITNND